MGDEWSTYYKVHGRKCQIVENFQKTLEAQRVKKKSCMYTTLKINSLIHSLHLVCRVMNSQQVNLTHPTCRCQFTLDIANPAIQ